MTLLSLFMTSTGIFCFVPISQRLVESGIIPASNSWHFWSLPSVLAPTFHSRYKEKARYLLAADESQDGWWEDDILLCSADGGIANKQPETMYGNKWSASISNLSIDGLLPSTSLDEFDGPESASFFSDSTLCDSCNNLLRSEIPPDHIPSVIRALTLFKAQDRSSDIVLNECDVAALTNAFSMLRL